MSRRSNPPQGRTHNHDHSEAGQGGKHLDAGRQETQDTRLVDARNEGFVPIDEMIPVGTISRSLGGEASAPDANDVWAWGNFAYVAADDGDLIVVDISDPGHPVEVGRTSETNLLWLVVSGTHAYAHDSDVVRSFDISNPESPSSDGSVSPSFFGGGGVVEGDRLYIAGGDGTNPETGVSIIDISDPSNPSIVTEAEMDNPDNVTATAVDYQSGVLYITNAANSDGSATGVASWDVSDEQNPVELGRLTEFGSVDEGATGVFDVVVRGDFAYLANRTEDGVAAVDIRDPKNMSVADELFDTDDLGGAQDLALYGRYLYVTAQVRREITAVDVQDLENPSMEIAAVGSSDLLNNTSGIDVADGVLYAGMGGSDTWMAVVGVAEPADTGTVTASGGSTPAVDTTLTDVGIGQTDPHNVVVYVDADPSFDADYAFNYDWGFQWDDSDSGVDINLTVNWDTDPGAGNDVDLRWEIVRP